MLHNPGNFHWVNKDSSVWAKKYFDERLTTVQAEANGVSAKITKVASMDGDVDVSQRKGKLITIFDVKITLEFEGKTADGEEVEGKIEVPEVAHDTEEDEYVFSITITADDNKKQPVRDLVRSGLVPQLRKIFAGFSADLLETQGKDIQHAAGTPLARPSSHVTSSSSAQTTAKGKAGSVFSSASKSAVVNTTTLKDSYEFQTSADQLYQTFTDPQRIAAFTRAPPTTFEPKQGGKFVLFGGNVQGEFVSLEENKKIVQKWRLANWPAEHYSTMNFELDQGTSETRIKLVWENVPLGEEDVSKRNFDDYYIKSIKQTFGFGAVL